MEPLGEKFDPNFHDAMFEAPDATREAGTVMHVATPGYMLHERCLRAAGASGWSPRRAEPAVRKALGWTNVALGWTNHSCSPR